MKTTSHQMILPSKSIVRIVLVTGAILLLPLIAMQFTDEVVWDVADFVIFGVLLVGAGVIFELIAKRAANTTYRSAIGVALGGAFMLVWMNAAVGIIGSENNDANLMYGGVLAIGIIGALIARLQPSGMVRVMLATALAQLLAAVIALMAGLGKADTTWPFDILMLTAFFTTLWLLSAWLFRKAAQN